MVVGVAEGCLESDAEVMYSGWGGRWRDETLWMRMMDPSSDSLFLCETDTHSHTHMHAHTRLLMKYSACIVCRILQCQFIFCISLVEFF